MKRKKSNNFNYNKYFYNCKTSFISSLKTTKTSNQQTLRCQQFNEFTTNFTVFCSLSLDNVEINVCNFIITLGTGGFMQRHIFVHISIFLT